MADLPTPNFHTKPQKTMNCVFQDLFANKMPSFEAKMLSNNQGTTFKLEPEEL
jgi:hypothetical protein